MPLRFIALSVRLTAFTDPPALRSPVLKVARNHGAMLGSAAGLPPEMTVFKSKLMLPMAAADARDIAKARTHLHIWGWIHFFFIAVRFLAVRFRIVLFLISRVAHRKRPFTLTNRPAP